VEVTDEEDPYVYFTLKMTEEDFCMLKSQQGLLVDFAAFPSKFIQLVERCVTEHQTDSPKYYHTHSLITIAC
jgi:spindle assembly abnormal protein 6